MGVGHVVAGLLYPPASPLLAVGSYVIDLAPTPVKEWAVSTFGNADKPVLIASVTVVSLVLAAAVGVLARTKLRLALVLGAALILIGAVIAATRPTGRIVDAVPSLIAAATMSGLLFLLHKRFLLSDATSEEGTAEELPESPTDHNARETGALWAADRRKFLIAAAGTTAGAAALGFLGQRVGAPAAPSITAKDLPKPTNSLAPLPAGLETKYDGISKFVTPNDDFYRVDIALSVPRIDQNTWQLTIDGDVDKPLTLSYADLLEMPMIEKDITMTCVSNEVGGGYVGAARWLGVPVRELLDQVGVGKGVDQILSSADDGITISTPIQALTDDRDALLAVAMNGEPLSPTHGFPVRLVTPGLFGFVGSTKWITSMTATTYAKESAYWTDRDWVIDAPVLTQSRIDTPRGLETNPAGPTIIGGVAWAQQRGITKVEVRVDDGEWQEATLGPDAGIDYWRQWYIEWDATPGRHTLSSRATDTTGETQTDAKATPFPSGATGWHSIVTMIA
ncbi:sulfite oxidase [Epidermidibacterium keratini]